MWGNQPRREGVDGVANTPAGAVRAKRTVYSRPACGVTVQPAFHSLLGVKAGTSRAPALAKYVAAERLNQLGDLHGLTA